MVKVLTENHIEGIIIHEFIELGYICFNGSDISAGGHSPEREYNEVVLKARLEQAVAIIKPGRTYINA